MSAPPALIPGRLAWVDVARGLALVSMFVAHTAPDGGPAGVLNLSEFLTAALFAALVGVSAVLERRRHGGGRALLLSLVRALALVGAAWVTSLFGAFVVDILTHLAVITVLMAVLGGLPARVRLVLGVVSAGAGVWITQLGALAVAEGIATMVQSVGLPSDGALPWTAEHLTAGPYRLPLLLAWALLGSALLDSVGRVGSVARRPALLWAGGGALIAVTALAWSRWRTGAFPEPYSGSVLDVLVTGGLVLAVLGVCAAVVPAHRPGLTAVLAVPGSMTLSVYVAHQAYLGWVLRAGDGPWINARGTDDTWFNVVALIAAGLLLPLLWRAVVRPEPWRRGPLEGVVGLATRPLGRR